MLSYAKVFKLKYKAQSKNVERTTSQEGMILVEEESGCRAIWAGRKYLKSVWDEVSIVGIEEIGPVVVRPDRNPRPLKPGEGELDKAKKQK